MSRSKKRKHSQISYISRSAKVGLVGDATADKDAFPLCHTSKLSCRCPPIPFCRRAILRTAGVHQLRITLSSNGTGIVDLEHSAVFDRGPDEGVFEMKRQSGEREWEGDYVGR